MILVGWGGIAQQGNEDSTMSTRKGKLNSVEHMYDDRPKSFTKEKVKDIRMAVDNAWGDNDLSRGFATEELAAQAFSDAINPISIDNSVEIGANIGYEALSDSYYLSNPVTSYLPDAIRYTEYALEPALGARTAYVHTHGSVSKGAESFSGHNYKGGDIGFSKLNKINAYMASPSRRLYKFNFSAFTRAQSSDSRDFVSEVGK